MRVVWTSPARDQLAEILSCLSERSPSVASRFVTAVDKRVAQLEAHPKIGRVGRIPGTRELVLSALPYLMAYRVSDRIEILAVMHGAQEWPERF